jgi:Putative zinc-finger
MSCLRIDLRQKITSYAHNELSGDSKKQLESHLEECPDCRLLLAKITDVDHVLINLKRFSAHADSWTSIQKGISQNPSVPRFSPLLKGATGAAATILLMFLVFIWGRGAVVKQEAEIGFDPASYRSISLSQFPHTDEPHVATEGYVAQISYDDEEDEEEGDMKFRLVDDLKRPNHFVVCEIIAPYKMQPPPAGSRVRVYGVSRYDGKAQHQWFEVHPVLNIEPIQ